jgi:TonB family protein
MVISYIFLIVRKNESPEQIAMVDDKPKTEVMTESAPLSEPAGKSEQKEKQTVVTEKKKDIPMVRDERKPETENIKTDVRPERAEHDGDQPGKAEVRAPGGYYQMERKAAISAAAPKDKSSSQGQVQETVISSDDSIPIQSLSEVVVTAMGTSRTEEEENTSSYVPPEPEGGKKGFEKYIRENLSWPDAGHSGEKEIVVLSFPVHTDGSIDSIRVIRSPGKPFSDEAIRLLRSGPSWKPAEEDGKIIEEEVRVRIVFK